MSQAVGVVLAAGEGRRFGGPKAVHVLEGTNERLVDRAVRVLREAGCSRVIVVLGAWVGEVPDAEIVVNDSWRDGMGSSLRAALQRLDDASDVERVVISLVDLPGLTPEAIARVLASDSSLAQAAFDGQPGHPVLLARRHWAGVVESARGDRGAREYLRDHAGDLDVIEVGDVASGEDLDVRP